MNRRDLLDVRSAMQLQKHRGPDGEGDARLRDAVLGHVRLSIIDPQGGRQPMASEDESHWITFNGEIYNHAALREELEGRGHRFRTNCDTEVLLHSYLEYGPACLERLNGMFAFAIFDARKSELFLARDRMGIKPVYYMHPEADGKLVFASELKAFKAFGSMELELDHEGVDCFLAHRYVLAPRTLLKGVAKLPPGHYALWKDGRIRVREYWDIPTGVRGPTCPREASEKFAALLDDAVRLRLISDAGPPGLMLSGGLDSTILASVMAKHVGPGLKSFAISTSDAGALDERPYARLAAETFGADHREMEVSFDSYVGALDRFAWSMDDLVADAAGVLLGHVSQLAREHVKVALMGEGADELFAGYSYHVNWKPWNRQRLFNRLPRWAVGLMTPITHRSTRLARYLRYHRLPLRQWASDYIGFSGRGLPAAERRELVHPDLAGRYGGETRRLAEPIYRRSNADNLLDHTLYVDCKTWLPDDLLTKADRMSMAHSLEARVPFLDHRVVEFCASLPLAFKQRKNGQNGYTRKVLLRETYKTSTPSRILDRPKRGFSSPWQAIMTTTGKRLAREVLLDRSAVPFLQREPVHALIERAQADDLVHSQALFSLTLLGLWCRHFLPGGSA